MFAGCLEHLGRRKNERFVKAELNQNEGRRMCFLSLIRGTEIQTQSVKAHVRQMSGHDAVCVVCQGASGVNRHCVSANVPLINLLMELIFIDLLSRRAPLRDRTPHFSAFITFHTFSQLDNFPQCTVCLRPPDSDLSVIWLKKQNHSIFHHAWCRSVGDCERFGTTERCPPLRW